eukprot:scaffold1964_cov252-Isochrysis_galbana.AAC.4
METSRSCKVGRTRDVCGAGGGLNGIESAFGGWAWAWARLCVARRGLGRLGAVLIALAFEQEDMLARALRLGLVPADFRLQILALLLMHAHLPAEDAGAAQIGACREAGADGSR